MSIIISNKYGHSKSHLIAVEKCRQELLCFLTAHGYLKGKGTSMVTVTPVVYYKLSKSWEEKLSRVSGNHFT